ncbi:hypothetical protein KPL70_014045 [Citrus sinensis]|nr:hypothetical protein KPL70_014045 [Citrus sinensis]
MLATITAAANHQSIYCPARTATRSAATAYRSVVPQVTILPLPGVPVFQSNLVDQLPVAGISLKDPSAEYPHPMSSSSVILYETRQGKSVKPPPPVTSKYIVKDTGNCSPRYIRCRPCSLNQIEFADSIVLYQIPCTENLLKLSSMPSALMVQPLALPDPSEDPIPVVDFGESGLVRCCCCRGYRNPFMEFVDNGKSFVCNFCGLDGRCLDADERPELCRGTVEFAASREFMMRNVMPPVYFFLIDVSTDAVQTGATAAACSAIMQVISDLPVSSSVSLCVGFSDLERAEEGPRTMIGIATYDSTIQFYNLKLTLQELLMLLVADTEDVYAPFEKDVITTLSDASCACLLCLSSYLWRDLWKAVSLQLLETIIIFFIELTVPPKFGAIAGKYSNHVSE